MTSPVQTHYHPGTSAAASAGIDFRFAEPDDVGRINAMYNDARIRPDAGAKGFCPRTDAQWKWEFGAHRTHPAYAVAERKGNIIGTEGYIPIPMLFDGDPVIAGKDEDTLVHPDYRGRGILDGMYRLLIDRAATEDVGMLWGFTSSAVRPLLRNGFQCLGPFEAMRLELNSSRAAPASALSPLDAEVAITAMNNSDIRYDGLSVDFARQVGGLNLHLSTAFLEWRVFSNPFRSYEVIGAEYRSRLAGLAILKIEPDGRTGFVSDLIALDDAGLSRRVVIECLLAALVTRFREQGVSIAEIRPAGMHPYNQMLRGLLLKRGFVSVPPQHAAQFMVRAVTCRESRINDIATWRLCELMREY